MANNQVTGKEIKEMSMEEIMDLNSDEVEKAVGFIPLPHCIAEVTLGVPEFETNNDKVRMKIPYTIKEIIEVLEKDRETGEVVDFNIDDYPESVRNRLEFLYPATAGLNYFVATWKDIVSGKKVSEFPEALANLDVIMEISARKDRNDPDRINNGIKTVELAA